MRSRSVLLVGAALLAAGLGSAGALAYLEYLPRSGPLPGTTVEGYLKPDGVALGDWLELRRKSLLTRELYLELPDGDGNFRTTFGALGIEVDVAETMRRVERHASTGSFGARLYRAKSAREGHEDIPLAWSFDRERAAVTLKAFAEDVRREPVDARLDLVGHRRIDDVPGRSLDLEGTLTLLADGQRAADTVVPLWTKEVRAAVTRESLATVDVTKVLGAFETDFKHKARSRDVNIRTAAEYLNGTVIAPSQTVSFNTMVGPRRIDRGFGWAPVIVADELEPGVGGGTCQVATALHAAAVHGVLDVVERRSHSRPSGYAPLGLDATVVYGEVDLKIRNPYDSPLIIHAFFPNPHLLRIELLGRDPPGKVEHKYAVIRSHDFYRRVWTKPFLEAGKQVKRQRGIRGYDVVSIVSILGADGRTQEKRYFSWYRPVPEVYWVGPGTDAEALPALPTGAEHVEVDGKKPGQETTAAADQSSDSADVSTADDSRG
ncbi:MAG: VanW family protein [Polyangiaceae bacterium]